MHIAHFGQGSHVVFFHGCPTPPDILEPIGRALSEHRTVHFIHSPGYGQSPALPPGPEGPSMASIEAEMEKALLSRGIHEAAFVGYSLGAYHALALAIRSGVRVTKIVSLAGIAHLSDEEKALRMGAGQMMRAGTDIRSMMASMMASPGFLQREPKCAEEILRWMDATTPENLLLELDAITRCENLLPGLTRVTAPLLARVGDLDAAAPPKHSQEIVRAVPHGTLEIVPCVGHALLLEDREGTIESVKRFLLNDDPR